MPETISGQSMGNPAMTLAEIHKKIMSCTACPLHEGTTLAVPGEGSPNATVMLIGEAPGFNEDKQGRPFVGQAGKFLNELLAEAGLKREEVYITNTVKHRPPENRDPRPDEMDTCWDLWLKNQIALLKPKVIVTLGRHSLGRFFPQETISRAHGKPRLLNGILFYPMYHPAAALHQQQLRETLIQDMRALPKALEDAQKRAQGSDKPAVKTPPKNTTGEDDGPRQLSML